MKHILLISLLIWGLWGCSDDDGLVVDLPGNAFSFRPIAGGAVMQYALPSDPNIVGVNVRYRNAFGVETLRGGGIACDTLTLIGFKEAQSKVPAQVTLAYCNGAESQPIDVNFSTLDSGPVSFMKTVNCYSNWEGFSLSYHVSEGAKGMAHVFYLGTNPFTHLPDTVLVNSFFLEESEEEEEFVSYKIKQDIDDLTVVVKVEDFLGYMVDTKVWTGIKNVRMQKLEPNNFGFWCDNSVEDPEWKLGVQYLFDGDTKGVVCFEDKKYHSFLAGPDAAGEYAHPMYIDLKENRLTASVRLYNLFRNESGLNWFDQGKAALANVYNENEMPCEMTVYGLKDNGKTPSSYNDWDALEGWKKIGTFKQDKGTAQNDRWCKYTWNISDVASMSNGLSLVELRDAEESYMEAIVPVYGQEEGYRYLKIVINEVFSLSLPINERTYGNTDKYVQFHELEVYTNKD